MDKLMLNVRLPATLADALDAVVDLAPERSRSSVVRDALRQYLAPLLPSPNILTHERATEEAWTQAIK
jgi:metal-responsive CopG/Arc/MetJ family transcriptional regulator